ncbi:MAG: MATE family efflux transporter [Candidatus Hydrogenedentes bacterium]|nr:MATE family efflux transporter [Candidatus Hydrogenedentota bacterium]
MKPFDPRIISGSRLRSVWILTWPLVALNLVNGTHGFIDHVLVGRFVESTDNAANAAIGVAWQMFMVIVILVVSIFQGMNVLIAHHAGKQDRAAISEVFHNALLASIVSLLCILAPIGYFCAPGLLRLLEVAPEVQRHALPYLRLLFLCGSPLFLMFLLTGAFNASGDPRTPLKLGVLTTILNIVISIVLITGMGPFPPLGVVGAGLGTVLAPIVSCAVGLYLIYSGRMIIQPPKRFHLRINMRILQSMIKIGVPTGIQGVLLNIAGVLLIWYISSLPNSAAVQAAYTICYTQLFSLIAWPAFGLRNGSSTLMGQNIGAGKAQRGKECVTLAAFLGASWAVLVGLLFWVAPDMLLGLFNATEEPVRGYGVDLLRFLAVSGVLFAINQAQTGALQGAGATRPPMVIAFATQIVVLLGLCQIFNMMGMLSAQTIWIAVFSSHILRLILTALVFRSSQWMHIPLDLGSSTREEPAPVID